MSVYSTLWASKDGSVEIRQHAMDDSLVLRLWDSVEGVADVRVHIALPPACRQAIAEAVKEQEEEA